MPQNTLKRIQDIAAKMEILKQQQAKLTTRLEQKIIKLLHKEQAFSYELETLLGGIQYVIHTMKNTDETSQKVCASWKSMSDIKPRGEKKDHKQTPKKAA